MDYLVNAILIGAGATVVVDLWAIARKQAFEIPLPNYGLVGRWLAHLARGQFRHESIAASPPVPCERVIGWVAHYIIGVAFAGLLLAVWGLAWVRQPTLEPALLVGIGTVAAPFLIMQPGMGAGVAASRLPRPAAARLQSIVTHTIFGLGLYAAGWVARFQYVSWTRHRHENANAISHHHRRMKCVSPLVLHPSSSAPCCPQSWSPSSPPSSWPPPGDWIRGSRRNG